MILMFDFEINYIFSFFQNIIQIQIYTSTTEKRIETHASRLGPAQSLS